MKKLLILLLVVSGSVFANSSFQSAVIEEYRNALNGCLVLETNVEKTECLDRFIGPLRKSFEDKENDFDLVDRTTLSIALESIENDIKDEDWAGVKRTLNTASGISKFF